MHTTAAAGRERYPPAQAPPRVAHDQAEALDLPRVLVQGGVVADPARGAVLLVVEDALHGGVELRPAVHVPRHPGGGALAPPGVDVADHREAPRPRPLDDLPVV